MQYTLEYKFDTPYTRAYICRMDISSRLDQAMKEAGFPSQSALAKASGVPQPTVNRILQRTGKKGPEADTVRKLAAACNVSFDWLNEGVGPKQRGQRIEAIHDEEDQPDAVRVRKVTLRLSAGIAGFVVDQSIEDENPIFFRNNWLAQRGYKSDKLIAIRVKGPSMEPGLYEGDTVVINTADTEPKDGEVFAVNYEGEAVIKRLVRDSGQWWLASDNPDQRRFPRKECSGEACLIIGRVIHKQSERI
jgi:phage repressor protein C with HTH and peptisase S24 domain